MQVDRGLAVRCLDRNGHDADDTTSRGRLETIAAVHGVEYIEAEDVRRHPFRVALTPLPSLNAALRDAAGAERSGTPRAWCAAIRAHLRSQDYDTLAPFITSAPLVVPDALLGLGDPPGESLKEGIERMMATPGDELAAELAISRELSAGDLWRDAERDPRRWLRRYVASLLRAWKGFGPIWRQARPAIQREVERVGVATALDAQLELLDGLLANGAVEDGRWCFRWGEGRYRVRFPPRGVVLIPMAAGDSGSVVGGDTTEMRHIAYPVRAALELEDGQPSSDALEALLGIPRAEILRALERPTSVGRLAEGLHAVPSAATHHVAALEAAGLVARDRRGRHVMVRRTGRGEALLELYVRSVGSRRALGS
jgi:DNA-binding transcriptional ArsR family regulator